MNVAAGLVAFAVSSVLLAAIASATAPGFVPGQPAEAVGIDAAAPARTAGASHPIRDRAVEIEIDGAPRAAIVTEPTDVANAPAIVLVVGSGPSDRTALAAEAAAFARAGIVTVRYDKRQEDSGPFVRDYRRLADDAAAVAAWAGSLEQVDSSRVGLVGWSEGGWVAPLAAASNPSIAFVGAVSGPMVTPLENAAFTVDQAIAATPPAVRAVPAAVLVGGRFLLEYVDFDLRTAVGRLDIPVHAVFGADDPTVPIAEAIDRLRAFAPAASVEIVAGASHTVPVATGGWVDRVVELARGETLPPGSTIGAQPTQAVGLVRLPEAVWQLDPRLHFGTALALGVAAAYLVPRRRGPRARRGRSRIERRSEA